MPHLERLVSRDGEDLHGVQALLEQPAGGPVAQIVKMGVLSPDRQKALHLAMQSLESEAPVSLSLLAGACYPEVVLQARFIENARIVVPDPS
jgi:hypothetical protein